MDCHNDTAMVSWATVPGDVSYSVVATSTDGHRASCETGGVSCQLMELLCGQVYSVALTAINNQCQTLSPNTVTFSTRESSGGDVTWPHMWFTRTSLENPIIISDHGDLHYIS